jgi:tetratricopeptide (TPR) repeat protein
MIVRAKTKRRLIILLCCTATIAGGVAAFVLFQLHQRRVKTEQFRLAGLAAFESNDFAAAAEKLRAYADRAEKPDANVLYKLAQAYKALPDPQSYNAYLQRCLELRPSEIAVRREMVESLINLRLLPEAIKQIDEILTRAPSDYFALSKKALVLREQNRPADALRFSFACNQARPLDVEMGALTLELFGDPRIAPDDKRGLFPHFLKTVLQFPDDPRALAMMAGAYQHVDAQFNIVQRQEAWKLAEALDTPRSYHKGSAETMTQSAITELLISKAASFRYDAITARLLSSLLELHSHEASVRVLEMATNGDADAELRLWLVFNLWQSQHYDDVLARLKNVAIVGRSIDEVVLLVLKADCLAKLGRMDEARAAIAVVRSAPVETYGKSWAVVLDQCALGERLDWPKLLDAAAALRPIQGDASRGSECLRLYLAQAYARMGEYDQAIDWLDRDRVIRNGRISPRTSQIGGFLSVLYGDLGRPREAIEAAFWAMVLSPQKFTLDLNPPTELNFAMPTTPALINFALVYSRFIHDDNLKKAVAEVQRRTPGEDQTLPLHVLMLVRANELENAKSAIRQSLASPTTRPSVTTLAQLALLSRQHQLDLADQCEQRIAADGGYTPSAALIRATELFAEGKTDAGAAFLQARKDQAGGDKLSWRLAWARYLDLCHDARAAAEWTALADDPAAKSELDIQRTALSVVAVQPDVAFLQRTIDRIRAATGDKAIGWRLAQANLLLGHRELDPDYSRIGKILEDILQATPNRPEVHKLRAQIAERQNDRVAQIEHLKKAAALNPSDMAVTLDLARIYQARSAYLQAEEQIATVDTFLRSYPDALTPSQRLAFALALHRQGLVPRAVEVLEVMTPAQRGIDGNLLLAELYALARRNGDAERLYTELLKTPTDAIRLSAADYLAGAGRADEARKLLAALELTGAAKELALTQYDSRRGNAAQAIEHAHAAVTANPKDAAAWLALVRQQIAAGQIKEAIKTADEAAGIAELNIIRANRGIIEPLAERADLAPLMLAMVQDTPDAEHAPDALRIYAQAKAADEPPATTVGKLRALADQWLGFAALQSVLAMEYRRLGLHAASAEMALRAANAWPGSPDMAALAAASLTYAGNWPRARELATRWRDLTPEQPMGADGLLAALDLRDGNLPAATKRIQPYLAAAIQQPEDYKPIVLDQAQVLIRQGQISQAAELLRPQLAKSAVWRQNALDLVMPMSDPDLSAQWLRAIASDIPAAESMALANCWYTLAVRYKRDDFATAAIAAIDRLGDAASHSANPLLLRALIDDQFGRKALAEAGYRAVLKLDQNAADAMNNLAMLLSEKSPAETDEARKLAAKATELRPGDPAFHDTLATVLAKGRELPDAIASMRTAVGLEPRNPQWLIGLAELCVQAGRTRDAEDALVRVDLKALTAELKPRFDSLRIKLRAAPTTTTAPSR